MRFSIICGMALRDYWHERALSLCAVLALATVLAPLLILFGVRNGVISNLQERLLQDPRNLEIVPVGSGKYGKEASSRVEGCLTHKFYFSAYKRTHL